MSLSRTYEIPNKWQFGKPHERSGSEIKCSGARAESFFGIIIRMFVEVGEPHHTPHFHAYYQAQVGIFAIESVELIAGDLPRRQRRLVEAWAELHQAELIADWNTLQEGRHPQPIEPLK